MPSLGGWEWVILAVVALLLFGGSRLAGVGKSAGKAIREFKEETSSLKGDQPAVPPAPPVTGSSPTETERKPETEA